MFGASSRRRRRDDTETFCVCRRGGDFSPRVLWRGARGDQLLDRSMFPPLIILVGACAYGPPRALAAGCRLPGPRAAKSPRRTAPGDGSLAASAHMERYDKATTDGDVVSFPL